MLCPRSHCIITFSIVPHLLGLKCPETVEIPSLCSCRDLTEVELEAVIDLRPFMQRTPFIVHGNASLARTYRIFRTMGLHHLFVGPAKPRVIGMVTRKVTLLFNSNRTYSAGGVARQYSYLIDVSSVRKLLFVVVRSCYLQIIQYKQNKTGTIFI